MPRFPVPISKASAVLSGRLAAAERLHPEQADDLRAEFKTARLADAIRATVDTWPPLTPQQRADLAALLVVSSEQAAS